MTMNVLLATDGRPHSDKATKYAMEYAKVFKAKLFIVFVVSPKADEDKERLVQNGMQVLDRLKNQAKDQGIDVTTLLEAGNPYESILAASERMKADAIIVGTSGKTVLDRVLIGSVSEYVVRNSRCTVIIVK
ncbi:MAG: universal stress protein [Methanomassiliicoccales archaeon]|nr:MAG: universal stress protein [Methanomassiliicoccales archaeon]